MSVLYSSLAVFAAVFAMIWVAIKRKDENFINVPLSTQPLGSSLVSARPTYQNSTAPRMSAYGVSSQTRGRRPPTSMQGVTTTGRNLTDLVQSTDDDGPQRPQRPEYLNPKDMMPRATMETMTHGKDPTDPNTFMFDRIMTTTKKRRNLSGADMIRGDLRIKPVQRGIMDTYANPHLDLRKGALSILGGHDDLEAEVTDEGTTFSSSRYNHLSGHS